MAMDEDGGENRTTDDEEALMKEWAAMAGDDTGDGGGEGGGESDAMAAEWEAMLGGGDEDGGGDDTPKDSTRVLNQDEIDSLLGFDDDQGHGDDKSGIQAILNSALVSYERLPMLEVVFDRLVRMMSTSMRNFTSDNELDPAAGHAGGVQGRGMGQLRPADRRFVLDLFHRRCVAGRPARHCGHAYRRPPLYHHRTQSGRAHGPCGAVRSFGRL
jgi:hypothetical protein